MNGLITSIPDESELIPCPSIFETRIISIAAGPSFPLPVVLKLINDDENIIGNFHDW